MRRDATFAIALGARSTENLRVLNQKSLTASHASVMRPFLCQGKPSQNPRLVLSPLIRQMLPISRAWLRVQPEAPVPCISAPHCRKRSVAIIRIGTVGGIGPGNDIGEIANDLPMW